MADLNKLNANIQAMAKKPIRNYFKIRQQKKLIVQAVAEGQRDALTPPNRGGSSTSKVVDKNNYTKYSSMVCGSYDMYNASADYGAEVFPALIDLRVALLGGEGLNVNANKPATQDFIDKFLKVNKLSGSRLMQVLLTGELEGKDLIVLSVIGKGSDKEHIRAQSFSWYINNYTPIISGQDVDFIEGFKYKDKKTDEEMTIDKKQAVYIRLGGTEFDWDETPHKTHKVLTQCANVSRAGYDLRKNGHLWGKISPTWKLDFNMPGWQAEAKAINNNIAANSYEIGDGYAGPADFELKGPPPAGVKVILDGILTDMKFIANNTGIPIHLLSWPELMSNRATAENISKLLEITTRKDRLLWEEAFTELIEKAMVMAIDSGLETNAILGDFNVKLPLVEMETIIELVEKWAQFVGTFISKEWLMNQIPGIDPILEQKRIEAERKKAAEESPLNNDTNNDTLNQLQNEEEEEE